jgi:hypothetical protein
MNIITLDDKIVKFIGFDRLKEDSVITVRIMADKLVINSGDVQTPVGKLQVCLQNKESNDPNLYDLVKYYCGEKPTSFISSKDNQIEYIQSLPVT